MGSLLSDRAKKSVHLLSTTAVLPVVFSPDKQPTLCFLFECGLTISPDLIAAACITAFSTQLYYHSYSSCALTQTIMKYICTFFHIKTVSYTCMNVLCISDYAHHVST